MDANIINYCERFSCIPVVQQINALIKPIENGRIANSSFKKSGFCEVVVCMDFFFIDLCSVVSD